MYYPPEEAPKYLGPAAMLFQADNPTPSACTQALLAWKPSPPGLPEDIAEGHYFKTSTSPSGS